jgi:hypothetical protein
LKLSPQLTVRVYSARYWVVSHFICVTLLIATRKHRTAVAIAGSYQMPLEINPARPEVHPRDVYNIDFTQNMEWAVRDSWVLCRGM